MKKHLLVIAAIMFVLGMSFMPAIAAENPDKLPWKTDVKQALMEAKDKGLPVIINFTSKWETG